MPAEPADKRTIAFVDGQNLFHAAREAFGYTYPSYDVVALALAVCSSQGWRLVNTRFYTGVPDPTDGPFWHAFWTKKLLSMSRQGVHLYSRPIRYRNRRVRLPDGGEHVFLAGEEKGIDESPKPELLAQLQSGQFAKPSPGTLSDAVVKAYKAAVRDNTTYVVHATHHGWVISRPSQVGKAVMPNHYFVSADTITLVSWN